MQYYRVTSHTRFDSKYHLIWITKYRKRILTGEIGLRTRDIIRQICERFGVDIIRGNVSPDHVHIFVSISPHYSVSKIVQNIKGRSSRLLQQEFPQIRREYWGRHFWGIGFFCVTSGNVTDEMIMQYIEEQGNQQDDEIFQVNP
ncbi:MAG: IS200/IS605 family transposase [Patescibacteria group bacterium]